MEDEQYGYEVKNLCQTCKHRRPDLTSCEAFPSGIPLIILLGHYDHNNEYNQGGVSDNFVRYEPIDK